MRPYGTSVHTQSIATSMTPTPSLPSPLTKKDLVYYQEGATVRASHRPTGCWVSDDNPERALERLALMVSQRIASQK